MRNHLREARATILSCTALGTLSTPYMVTGTKRVTTIDFVLTCSLPVQPPPGLPKPDRLVYIRNRTHIELGS
jgi:hypothetical protein